MRKLVPKYLADLIAQKESQTLDFKYEISDAKKIAKTLVAFANTDGGKLLIGVKDNGNIAGVRSDEELYMIDAAAKLYCKPKIDFTFRPWQVNKKTVLEVTIEQSNKKPHFAHDEHDRWRAYIRVGDQNFVANSVMIRVWKGQRKRKPIKIKFNRNEDWLLHYLQDNDNVTFSRIRKITGMPPGIIENMLVDLILLDLIDIRFSETGVFYVLKDSQLTGENSF